MALLIGDVAPDFEADTTIGHIHFYQWLGDSWGVLFSHPKDFTPVCTTELGETGRLKGEFAKRGAKVVGLSVDTLQDHNGWKKDIEETQHAAVDFPMIADPEMKVANLYGMIHPNASDRFTVRSVFIIDPKHKVRMTLNYPASAGRNFQEILRVLDSLQLTDKFKVATPVNWKQGDDVIISTSVSNEDAKKLFPAGWKELKPYLRVTRQPRG